MENKDVEKERNIESMKKMLLLLDGEEMKYKDYYMYSIFDIKMRGVKQPQKLH